MALAINVNALAQASFSGGDGSTSAPYLITTSADLAALASLVNAPATNVSFANKHYRLAFDIDLSGYANWTPIGIGLIRTDTGDDRLTFRGVFDGAGKKIINLKIARADRIADSFLGQGLFGVIDGGTVKNLGLDGVSIDVNVGRVGGVAGAVSAGSVIDGCYVIGDISGAGSVGGIVGHADDSSAVNNCYAVGDVSGTDRVGGVAGYVYNSAITSSYAVGNVRENGSIGNAVAGHVWNSAITESSVFVPQTDTEEMLAVIPEPLLTRVVAVVNNVPPIVAIIDEPTGKFIAGPNPVNRLSGSVNFFRYGTKLKKGTLSIYNSYSKVVQKISLADGTKGTNSTGWRRVGLWNLKDRNGQMVSEGTYVVKGTIYKLDGKKERVSIPLGIK